MIGSSFDGNPVYEVRREWRESRPGENGRVRESPRRKGRVRGHQVRADAPGRVEGCASVLLPSCGSDEASSG